MDITRTTMELRQITDFIFDLSTKMMVAVDQLNLGTKDAAESAASLDRMARDLRDTAASVSELTYWLKKAAQTTEVKS